MSSSPVTPPDSEAVMEAAAGVLGLTIDPSWREAVLANLRVLRAAAELVEGFPLPDEAEVAPVFEA